jgi:alkylation response protein AidB-like acyl-CoA dehydrogenase
MALKAARAGLIAANQAGWDAAVAGEDTSGSEVQTEMRCAAIYAAEVSAEVCQTMFKYAGGKSLFVGNVIERCLRDVRASAQHAMVNDAGYETRGQVLLGLSDVAALS